MIECLKNNEKMTGNDSIPRKRGVKFNMRKVARIVFIMTHVTPSLAVC